MFRFQLAWAAALAAAVLTGRTATAQTWTGAVSTDWSTAGNWSPATVPNSFSAVVNFTGNGLGTVNISPIGFSSAAITQSVTFSNPTGGYMLTSSPNEVLDTTALTVAAGVTGTQTINLDPGGGLGTPAGNNLVVTNNSTAAATTLLIGPSTDIRAAGNLGGKLIFAGPGTTQLSGSFSGSFMVVHGLTQNGPGRLIFSGDGSNLQGGLFLNGGTLELNYATNTATKLGSGALQLNGGVLQFTQNAGNAVTQSFSGGTLVAAGHTDISEFASGAAVIFAAGNITRSAGATVDFSMAFPPTTTTGTTNGLLGSGPAFATVNGGNTWATVSGNTIVGLTNYSTNSFAGGLNTDVTTSSTVGNITTNSIRFDTANVTLTLSGTNTIQSGGILVTGFAGNSGVTITGGTLTSGTNELVLFPGPLTINSAISASAGLTIEGYNGLTLGGNNTGLTGPINVNRPGVFAVTTPAAVNSASQINFNDSSHPGTVQFFLAAFGDNTNGAINPPINLSTPNMVLETNNNNSRVALAGVISSAGGLTTAIQLINGLPTGGYNLTGSNTFTGNVILQTGFLGINSDASLGNAANTLWLQGGSATLGGLEFLNGGVTVARPVLIGLTTRIISNGNDSNTISGPISGSGGLVKDGTGTLVLTNASNSFTGGTTVSGGTLRLGAVNALPAAGAVTVGGGTLDLNGFDQTVGPLALTSSAGAARPTITTGAGTLTLAVDLTMNGDGGTTGSGGGPGGQIAGKLDLGGTTRSFTIAGGSSEVYDLVISAAISGTGGLTYNGLFGNNIYTYLALNGSNSYTGPTTVNTGILLATAANALPATTAINLTTANSGLFLTAPATANGVTAGSYSQSIVSLSGVAGSFVGTGSASLTITNSPGITFPGDFEGSGLLVMSGGTLILSGSSNSVVGVTVNAGTLSLSRSNASWGSASVNGGFLSIGATNVFAAAAPVTMTGGTFSLFGFDQSIGSLAGTVGMVQLGYATLTTGGNNTSTSFTGIISGPGVLAKTGSGTFTLGTAGNSFSSLTISGGTVQTANDNTLGVGPITIGPLGTLSFTGTTTTGRTIANSGTITVAAGQTLMFNAATVGGGFLRGLGTYAVTGGASLTGVTTFSATTVNVTGAASFTNFTNGGALTIASNLNAATVLNGFTNQGSGSIIVGASSQVIAPEFQTYGTLTLSPGTTATPTQLTNMGASNLYFNGGSRTFISIPAHANPNQFDAGIDLHGQNAVVAGGLFVNNGYVVDSMGSHVVIADFGSLVKGAGFYQNTVQTVNGGKFQSGNSPGRASFGSFVFGPGGVSNYVFAIDDAAGAAGPIPDSNGNVSGWGLVKTVQRLVGGTTTGDFTWTATPTDKLTVSLDTLVNPTIVGTDLAGPMADFDPAKPYSWLAASWAGNYSGPTDTTALNATTVFDTSGFQNPIAGTFGWSLDAADHTLSLTYTPGTVPEPGSLALTGLAALGFLVRHRRAGSRSQPQQN
jgi:autotransporter-associated beta strand protein